MESDVLNGAHGSNSPGTITNWTGIGPFAGLAIFGIEARTSLLTVNNVQCDTVWEACVFAGANSPTADTPTIISNVAQKCSGFANVWPKYYGVEVGSGSGGLTISML